MDKLPPEIKQQVLSSLPNLDSLKAAALSCPIVVEKSSCLESYGHDAVRQFGRENLATRPTPSVTHWKLVDALPLERFHVHVHVLAEKIMEKIQHNCPSTRSDAVTLPNRQEIVRVERALYRFQLYCNLFREGEPDHQKQRDVYFSYFSAWENEQLACVHDLLVRMVAIPFNDLVEHDIEVIHQLVNTTTYDERIGILGDGECYRAWNEDPKVDNFLHRTLQTVGSHRLDSDVVLLDLSNEEWEQLCGRPFYREKDCGSRVAWKFMYANLKASDALVANPNMLKHRLWGYVFWNFRRVWGFELLVFLLQNGRAEEEFLAPDELTTKLDSVSFFYLAETYAIRKKLWKAGARGWWSAEDLSYVVWP
ncbi:hypothetical protein F5Y04DRAFT_292552 [Hypomontagnella monticulosa]|nr:hypothetical protein F5Y04DRAFT_292552 [Hypomontagnella monticulosa]